jgi:hypothetical protein
MRKFDLSTYALVDERLRAFWRNPITQDARIVTHNVSTDDKTWIIKTEIFIGAGDQANALPKVTGWASELRSDQFALERCETSSIGRALANWLWTGSKELDGTPRPSREEMEKVERVAQPATDWIAEAQGILNVNDLRNLYTRAKAQGAPADVLEQLKDYANALNSSSEDTGTRGSVPGSGKGGKH